MERPGLPNITKEEEMVRCTRCIHRQRIEADGRYVCLANAVFKDGGWYGLRNHLVKNINKDCKDWEQDGVQIGLSTQYEG